MDEESDATITGVDQYYLQVKALTPLEESAPQANANSASDSNLNQMFPPLNMFVIGFIVTLVLLLSWRMVKLYGYTKTLGMAVMLLAAIGGYSQYSNQTSFSSKASPEFIPRELVIHEMTDSSFEMSWVTTGMTVSAIEVIEQGADIDSKMTFLASEDESKIHQVFVDGLESQTTYEITIFSGDGWYGNGNEPIKITTE